jgi:hypothetical protein
MGLMLTYFGDKYCLHLEGRSLGEQAATKFGFRGVYFMKSFYKTDIQLMFISRNELQGVWKEAVGSSLRLHTAAG